MAPTGVFQASSEEQGSHEVPSIFNVGPNSNAIEPISRKATLTVANQCQLPEDTTTTDASYRLVPVGVPSTDPDLISVKDHQPSDRTAVNPECGITYLADQQIQRNTAFIKTLWDPLIRRPEDLQYDFQMPHSDSERLGMYYALVQRLVALEIEIGLLDDVVFSLPIPPQSMTKLPALPRFNFYSKQLGQPMIMGPPATCDFHKGPGPEFITEKTFQSLGAYCIWLEYARDGVNKRIAELRLSVMKQLKIARDDPNDDAVSDCASEIIESLFVKYDNGEAVQASLPASELVRLPRKEKKKRNKGIGNKKRKNGGNKGDQQDNSGVEIYAVIDETTETKDSGAPEKDALCDPTIEKTFDVALAAAPNRVRTRKKKKGKGKGKLAQMRGGRHITQESVSPCSSEAETDSILSDTERLSKAASKVAALKTADEDLMPSIQGTPIFESGALSPGSFELSMGCVAVSEEVPSDSFTASSGWQQVRRKRHHYGKLHEKVRRAGQSQKKKNGKLERPPVSSVSTGNVEKTTGTKDPTPSPTTPLNPTPPFQLAALSPTESGHANLDETDADARGIEGEAEPWSPFMTPWARPDSAVGLPPDAQYHRSGYQIVSPGGAVNREGHLTEPKDSCRVRGFSVCGFYRACCYHRQRDLCGCPPGRSCCCLHHAGDCCHCLGPHEASAEFLTEYSDRALTRPRVPLQGLPGSGTVPSRRRALTG